MRGELGLIEAELAVQSDQFTRAGPLGIVDGRERAVAGQAFVKQLARGFRRKHAAIDEQVVDAFQTSLRAACEADYSDTVLHGKFQTALRPFLKKPPAIADSDQADRLMFMLKASDAKHHLKFRSTVPGGVVGRPRRILNHRNARCRPRSATE
jgi:hypothetical protein